MNQLYPIRFAVYVMFFGLILMTSVSVKAQGLNFEKGHNTYYNTFVADVVASDAFVYLVVTEYAENSFFTLSRLEKYDTLGNLQWSTILNSNEEVCEVQKMVVSEDGGVYVASSARPTCDMLIDLTARVQRFDPNGGILWTTERINQNGSFQVFSGLTPLQGNSLMTHYTGGDPSLSFVFSLDKLTGAVLDSISYTAAPLTGFSDHATLPFLASSDTQLLAFDNTGSTTLIQQFSSPILSLVALNDSTYVLTNDSLFVFDSGNSALFSGKVAGYGGYSDLKVTDATIRFISTASGQLSLLELDKQFQLISTVMIPTDNQTPALYDYSDNHLTVGADHALFAFKGVRLMDFSLKDITNQLLVRTDAELVETEILDMTVTAHPTFSGVYTTNAYLSATIRNNGNTVMNQVRLNYHIGQGIACNDLFDRISLTGLSLAPGATQVIDLGWTGEQTNFYALGNPIQYNICLYTSFPNELADLNLSNDSYCQTPIFGYSGVAENDPWQITVAPNPSNGQITVKHTSSLPVMVHVYDLNGKELATREMVQQQESIQLNLSKGLYVLRFMSGTQLLKTERLSIQ